MLVVGVDERAVDVKDRYGDAHAVCFACSPSRISSTILALKAGRSSGLRLLTTAWSTTTSSSTQLPPALRMSVCRLGHEVSVRPSTTSASTSVHGAWQIAATGLFCSAESPANSPPFSAGPGWWGLA